MSKFSLLKDWRILLLIAALIFATIAIQPSFSKGIVVESIDSNSPFSGIVQVGEKIEWANEKTITTVDDFYQFSDYTGVFRFMHSGKLELVQIDKAGLGMTVIEKPSTNLKFGMDIVGGTRVLLKPDETNVTSDIIQQTLSTLETRINTYGLKETKFQEVRDVSGTSYIQIEMAGGSKSDIDELLARQGMFEGKIPVIVLLEGGAGTLKIGDNDYSVQIIQNETLRVDDQTITTNQSIYLEDMKFELVNFTSDGAGFLTTVLTGNDVTSVCLQDNPGICRSTIYGSEGGGYQFMFQIFISDESANKFAKITKNMKTVVDPNTGESHLEARIIFYLDGIETTSLAISSDLRGKAVNQPAITGGGENMEEAVADKLRLQSILRSGAIPVKLEVVKVDQISPTLGAQFMKSAIFAILIAIFAVAGVMFIRYRNIKILIPMIAWSLFELFLVLGAAAMIKWTIDLASIAGIIAAIGVGTNDQVMMVDEIFLGGDKDRIYTLKQKIKRSFFIIFTAAGTTIAAMMPLLFIGIGVMKGFAITTVLGLLIGTLITRPAFARVAEKILENN